MSSEAERVVFLDRDGTLNEDQGYVSTPDAWKWIDGAIDGLKLLQDAGFKLAIITNQTGIGEGYYTEEDMKVVHTKMLSDLKEAGVTLSSIAYSLTIGDKNEKPKTGMVEDIQKDIPVIDFERSWTIGDKERDLQFGKNAGTKTVLIRSEYWSDQQLSEKPDYIADSLLQAAEYIVKA